MKYSPDGVHISVELEAPDEERLVLRVRDQGVGIPQQELKRIFKRFYRVTQRSLSQSEGDRPRIVHRALDRAQARRPCIRARAKVQGRERP